MSVCASTTLCQPRHVYLYRYCCTDRFLLLDASTDISQHYAYGAVFRMIEGARELKA